MKKVKKLSKEEIIYSMFGIPVDTPDSWYEEQLKIRESKWSSLDKICKLYNLGQGDCWRDGSKGQMTKDFYDTQDTLLIDFERTYKDDNETVWISEARDYFEYKNDKWVWKNDGQRNYHELVELNNQLKNK